MKKIYFLMAISLLMQFSNIVYASNLTVEPIYDENYMPLIYAESNTPPEFVQINGETYLGDSIKNTTSQIKYNPMTYEYLKEPGYDWDFSGEYYLRRYSAADNNSSRSQFKRMTFSIYDKNFNYLRESAPFDGYIDDVGYYNGTYYCKVYNVSNIEKGGYFVSTDLEKWTKETDEQIFIDSVGDTKIQKIFSNNENMRKVSVEGNNNFYNVAYEYNVANINKERHFGEWLLKEDANTMYLTSNDVYAVPLADSASLQGLLPINQGYQTYMYEYGDELIVEWRFEINSFSEAFEETVRGYRFRIPKQPVYDALEAQKSAPYVCVNNTILGFETPPVTESDRTLVPMRFLFEQLGADVTWDEATETATAKKANTTINFSIDNTTATVNGAATTMDVPARLVGDKTMVPLRFLSEEMGYTVEWDEETRMATITTPLVSRMAKVETTDVFGEWIR